MVNLTTFLSSPALENETEWAKAGLKGLSDGLKKSKDKKGGAGLISTVTKLEASSTESKKLFQDILATLTEK